VTSYPWQISNSHHYTTTEPRTRDGVTYEAGQRFQVSIPPAFHWLPVIRTVIHDPGWLARARDHDLDLKQPGIGAAARAAWRFLVDDPGYPTAHRWAIPPAFVAVLIWTTATRLLRRVFSWKEA
jgi:hypothetical protein